MADIKEDEKLEIIGKLLEKGGTMLAQHCECGAPLFRYQSNVICPICDSDLHKKEQVKTRKSSAATPDQSVRVSVKPDIPLPSAPEETFQGPLSETPRTISSDTYELIKNSLIKKIVQLCLDLQSETDLGRIKQQMEAIESGINALNNLKR